MLQRAMIAGALAGDPRVLIADEPTTALDPAMQDQVLDVLSELQVRLGLALVLITHDIGVVERMADDVAVMYAGRIVESGPAAPRAARAGSPVHAGSAGGRPGAGRGARNALRGARRRAARPHRAHPRLRVRAALPGRDRCVRCCPP